ncbi:MAG: hypothetical protein E7488_04140 [Ruminococcaceae bacterium]|nr:hypothetical protein [Oscillospiraceae bacterium]
MATDNLRNEIDAVYSEILSLFVKSMELSCELGREKAKDGKTLADRKREEEILEKAAENSPQNMQNYSIELFREIIKLSKQYYEDVK